MQGETWSVDGSGHRYNRYWAEDHHGDGTVRKHGSSTGGEHWDSVEHMDTYYNPVPHFGFHHAWNHSNKLRDVPGRPRDEAPGGEEGELGMGLGAL